MSHDSYVKLQGVIYIYMVSIYIYVYTHVYTLTMNVPTTDHTCFLWMGSHCSCCHCIQEPRVETLQPGKSS